MFSTIPLNCLSQLYVIFSVIGIIVLPIFQVWVGSSLVPFIIKILVLLSLNWKLIFFLNISAIRSASSILFHYSSSNLFSLFSRMAMSSMKSKLGIIDA